LVYFLFFNSLPKRKYRKEITKTQSGGIVGRKKIDQDG